MTSGKTALLDLRYPGEPPITSTIATCGPSTRRGILKSGQLGFRCRAAPPLLQGPSPAREGVVARLGKLRQAVQMSQCLMLLDLQPWRFPPHLGRPAGEEKGIAALSNQSRQAIPAIQIKPTSSRVAISSEKIDTSGAAGTIIGRRQ